ncbi:hypothetical protein SLS60_005161 [Paraconiothyrium brasiliense]|uniref:Uncharacterized protein n=1 Tax=Paraconiothyrium brasiliense TaxID=300254 RepID=A0ABR3RH10_9PLEO
MSPILFALLALLPYLIAADGPTGGDRLGAGSCPGSPPNVNETSRYAAKEMLVYSPFKPYWKFNVPNRTKADAENCWVVADCLFEAAGESRKQQFGATALVMGLNPPTIKDIAWPERRLIYVTKSLPWPVEMLALALGLVPHPTGNKSDTRFKGSDGAVVARYAWSMGRSRIRLCIGAAAVALTGCYAGLTTMEVFSKRSALGCVAPIFVLVWHIIALVPAVIHQIFGSLRRQRFRRRPFQSSGSPQSRPYRNDGILQEISGMDLAERPQALQRQLHIDGNDEQDEYYQDHREGKIVSAVQGATEDWPVQMAWGIYYIAGTLVFTSIMAVTVPELVVWVLLGLATAGCSKILALFLCLVYEETGVTPGGTVIPFPSSDGDGNAGVGISR